MIAKNSPCPCGSSKQYKRCCINDSNAVWRSKSTKNTLSKHPLLIGHPSAEMLKVLALIQLQPENHGKNIRMESAVSDVVNAIKVSRQPLRLEKLRYDIEKECPKDYREDPPDNFFSDNIIFSNGNNVVYPANFNNVIEILQAHINVLFSGEGLPELFVQDCTNAVRLLLMIIGGVARALEHTHRMFLETDIHELFTPTDQYILDKKDLLEFEFGQIKMICDRYDIPYNTLDSFVYDWTGNKLDPNDFETNPLLKEPFVFIDGKFILVMPTAIAACLVEFIVAKAKQYQCTTEVLERFADVQKPDIHSSFSAMRWKRLKIATISYERADDFMHIDESVWQVDYKKIAIVVLLTEPLGHEQSFTAVDNKFSLFLEQRLNAFIEKLKEMYPGSEVLTAVVMSKTTMIGYTTLSFTHVFKTDYFIHLSPVELEVLTKEWKFDQLTLWKYVKYHKLASQTVRFAPMMSDLSLFDFYQQHHGSFFDSDKEPYTMLLIDFSTDGEVRRRGLQKVDKIGIGYGGRNNYGIMQCVRKEEHYPVYVSQEYLFGIIKSCLIKYSCPIWMEAENDANFHGDLYINSMLYWLNEIYDDAKVLVNQMGIIPLRIKVTLHPDYYQLQSLHEADFTEEKDYDIPYSIDVANRFFRFTVPIEMLRFFAGPTNEGERILISFLLDTIGLLVEQIGGMPFDKFEKESLLDKYIPVSNKKFLITYSGDKDIRLADADIPLRRYIQESDISYVLENQLKKIDPSPAIGTKWETRSDKVGILNRLVSLHYSFITKELEKFDREALLMALMRKNEGLLQARAFRHISYPAKVLTYSKYYDVQEEFNESERKLVETSLGVRVLIEFAYFVGDNGTELPSEDAIDILLAHLLELINYASYSDSINDGFENPELSVLPSGRLGISFEKEREGFSNFRDEMYGEEMFSYAEEFSSYFAKEKANIKRSKEQKAFNEKLKKAFEEEWGITLSEMDSLAHSICTKLMHEKTSVLKIPRATFEGWLREFTGVPEDIANVFLKRLLFLNRPKPLVPPVGYEKWEIYPWRFNRRLSYLHRPIIAIIKNEISYLLISARHLLTSAENYIALFFNSALKVDTKDKQIIQLMAENNRIKGKQYRNNVLDWLRENTTLETWEYEIKIEPKGFFKSEVDRGDIDIMAFDRTRNVLFSLECKNTIQSKVTHEFKMEMDSYLGTEKQEGLITKHVNRHLWLENNIAQVAEKLELSAAPRIVSLVVSKNILPLKHIKPTPLPIISFFQLKSGKFSFEDYATKNFLRK